MSYDLYLKPKSGSLDREKIIAWFSSRPFYQVDGSQAWYQNQDTGVYFVFEFPAPDDAAKGDDNDGEGDFPLAFNMNYFRPSFFGLEAEPEVRAFVEAFDLAIEDPQMDGMGEGDYATSGFLSGWNAGNAFGVSAILREPAASADLCVLPRDVLLRSWHWNRGRAALQDSLGENIFVPRVMYLMVDGQAATAMVWPDGIPITGIEVDYLLVPRKELAPRKFFRKKDDTALLPWREAEAILKAHSTATDEGGFRMNYVTPPRAILDFVRSLSPVSANLRLIAADGVLDQELVESSAGGREPGQGN